MTEASSTATVDLEQAIRVERDGPIAADGEFGIR